MRRAIEVAREGIAAGQIPVGAVIVRGDAVVMEAHNTVWRDNDPTACPKEEHVLTFQSAAKGSCDTNFYFKVTKTNGAALSYPNQLKNKLKFADQTNPYINFQNLGGGVVSIDPTYGLNEDNSSSAGTCTAACTKISLANVATQCCSCGGVTKKFAKSAWSATTFLCQ